MRLVVAPAMLAGAVARLTRPETSDRTVGARDDGEHAAGEESFARFPPRAIQRWDADAAASSPPVLRAGADVGVLSRGPSSRRLQTVCPGDTFSCVDGLVDGTSTTCGAECGGRCCDGIEACDGFTGNLCKDDVTCNGYRACQNAFIDLVVGGCEGDRACVNAATPLDYQGRGTIEVVDGSCLGSSSCAYMARGEGMVGVLNGSCIGVDACGYLAEYGNVKIDEITDSCLGEKACYSAGYSGTVDALYSSCNGTEACSYLGAYNGTVGTVVYSCNGPGACFYAASCADYNSLCDSSISIGIYFSCNGDNACNRTAYDGGALPGMAYACNNEMACLDAARGGGSIPSGITFCCNGASECIGVVEATLPESCGSGPTTSPTVPPTRGPTVSPTLWPTYPPSGSPTPAPSTSPMTATPTGSPTGGPTRRPTASAAPSAKPTERPTQEGTSPGTEAAGANMETKAGKVAKVTKSAKAEKIADARITDDVFVKRERAHVADLRSGWPDDERDG